MGRNECEPRHVWPVLDTWVNDFDVPRLLDLFKREVAIKDRRVLIVNHNINSLALLHRNAEFSEIYDMADYCFIDGAPVVGLARIAGAPANIGNRVGVLDWIWPLFELAHAQGWKIVHLGSARPVLDEAQRAIDRRVGSVDVEMIDGFFDIRDVCASKAIVDQIVEAQPDVLLVGMGMPRQEKWLVDVLPDLPNCVIVTVGGIIGYLGGDRPTAPRWVGRVGLEWLFRLATEPGRLWRRYLIESLVLIPVVARWVVGRPWSRRGEIGTAQLCHTRNVRE